MIKFPDINPVLINIGPLPIRWYALAYILGVLLGYYYIKFLDKKHNQTLSASALDDIINYAVFGIILGGRLGYVLFYNPIHYLHYPLDIIKTWEGGMSFHGGAVGLITAMFFLCRKHKIAFLYFTDLIACATPIGLFLGRIANFINGELYGRPTDVAWGVIFPGAGNIIRHPSQIYEAFCEGLLLFCILAFLTFKQNLLKHHGRASGACLMLYSIFRIIIENYRQPENVFHNFLTMGQILSLPLLLLGLVLIYRSCTVR